MPLHWQAVKLRTGAVICDFPDMRIDGVRRTIGQYESATATFPVSDFVHPPPRDWFEATDRWTTMLVALADDDSPQWGGIVNKRRRVAGKAVELSLVTPEAYAARRNIRSTLQYPQTDRIFIASDLINRHLIDGASGRNGLPLRIDVQTFGLEVDGDYADVADKTIYSILQELGMEWTVTLERQSGPERITQVWSLSERLGVATPDGMDPAVTLDWPGNLVAAEVVEDYSEGRGGNDVMATSSGQGSIRPQSDHQTRNQPERPTMEIRESAGDNITRRAALNSYARQVLANRADGAVGYTPTLSNTNPVATAIGLGDDVGVDLSGPEFPDHPTGTCRIVGLQYDQSTVSPVVADAA